MRCCFKKAVVGQVQFFCLSALMSSTKGNLDFDKQSMQDGPLVIFILFKCNMVHKLTICSLHIYQKESVSNLKMVIIVFQIRLFCISFPMKWQSYICLFILFLIFLFTQQSKNQGLFLIYELTFFSLSLFRRRNLYKVFQDLRSGAGHGGNEWKVHRGAPKTPQGPHCTQVR